MISHHFFNVYQRLSLVFHHGEISMGFPPSGRFANALHESLILTRLGRRISMPNTLWLCQNNYWKWPFTVRCPNKNCDLPSEGSWLVYFMENPNLIAGWWFPLWLGGFMWFPKIWWISGYPFYGVDVEMGFPLCHRGAPNHPAAMTMTSYWNPWRLGHPHDLGNHQMGNHPQMAAKVSTIFRLMFVIQYNSGKDRECRCWLWDGLTLRNTGL